MWTPWGNGWKRWQSSWALSEALRPMTRTHATEKHADMSTTTQHGTCSQPPVMDLAARTRLQEELRRADRRSMFRAAAAEIAHELLTPLNVVQARAQLLTLRESEDEIDGNVQIILDQIKKVANLLRQMVDAASGE